MGIKKLFKIKPPEEATPEQNRETLNEMGISTKNPTKKRRERFAAYGRLAKDMSQDKVYAPEGYENYANPQGDDDLNKSELDGENENARNQGAKASTDLYTVSQGGSDPYAVNTGTSFVSDPYANLQASSNQASGYSSNNYSSPGPSYPNDNETSNNFNSAYSGYNPPENNNYRRADAHGSMRSENRTNANPYGTSSRGNSYSRNDSGNNMQTAGNPYSNLEQAPDEYSRSSFSSKSGAPGANPYTSLKADSYSGQVGQSSTNPYGRRKGGPTSTAMTGSAMLGTGISGQLDRQPRAPQGTQTANNRLSRVRSQADTLDLNKSSLDGDDLNQEPRAGEFDFEEVKPTYNKNTVGLEELDLNATIGGQELHDDLNSTVADQQQQMYQETPHWQIEEEEGPSQSQYVQQDDRGFKTFEELQREEEARQQQEEDEAVDEIKQEIRFTKQSSVASTRNTLKMAQEAEMSGMNSLGLLGHQSEKLNNIEGNLDLMKVQNKIADDKVAELKKLNRNILAIHVSNPFNSKRRQREREEKIKNRKIEEKLMQEQTSKELARSTQRIEGALNGNNEINTVREKYQRKQILDRSKQFQFENDEEDDMMEVEIDKNLDQIQQISGRLKKLAVATGEELDSQQQRVRNVEDNTDDLDIRIHLNTTRLSGIR